MSQNHPPCSRRARLQPGGNRSTTRRRALRALAAIAAFALACGGDIETRLAEVRALQDVGQFTESIDELREILAISPNLPEANYRLGVALMQTGEPSRAVWALQKATESPDYAIVAGLMLATAHYSIQNHEEAIRAADAVLEVDPERMVALLIRAQAHVGAVQLEKAWEDTSRLVELYPDEYRVRALEATVLADLGRLDESEKAAFLLREMGAASGDPELEVRSCLAPAYFFQDHRKDAVRAEAIYVECLEKYPNDSFTVSQSMKFFDRVGKPEVATDLIRKSVEAAPEALALRSNLANRLLVGGDPEGAEAVLVEAAESFGSAAAWNMLTTFYRRTDNPEQALAAIERVIELSGGGSDQLRFTQADILVDLGKLDRAEEVADSLKEPTYARLIRGRVLLERGDAAGALEAFDAGIRHWPNNAGARYLAGLAASELGDYERAMSELREAIRADSAATDAALVLARLHFERGEYKLAVNFANSFVRGPTRPRREQGYVVGIRSLTAQKDYERARKTLEIMKQSTDDEALVTLEAARIDRAEKSAKVAVATIDASGLDLTQPENEMLLRYWMEQQIELGRADRALATVDRKLAADPDDASSHELRGSVLATMNRSDEARTEFQEALQADPDNAVAVSGLATLAARGGDYSAGVQGFDRAAELEPREPAYAYSAAQLTLQNGDKVGAEKRLRDIVRFAPGHAGARNDLAWLLAEKKEDLDLALALAEEARRIDPSPEILDTLGYVHMQRGEAAAAVAALELAAEADDSPSIRYRLGTALNQAGDSERAQEMLEVALAAGAFPEREEAQRQLAALKQR